MLLEFRTRRRTSAGVSLSWQRKSVGLLLSGLLTATLFRANFNCSQPLVLVEAWSHNKPPSSVLGVTVHPVPLRNNDQASPYALASSNIADFGTVEKRQSSINFLATQVWPSARTAAHTLQRHLPEQKSVCEFGCGPGLPSLTAAQLGAPMVYATDLDEFALELVRAAANAQGFSERIETKQFDLVNSYMDEIPFADLYLFSDVFECNEVAEGAARIVAECLERRGGTGTVWVFAQSDRAQREVFLAELQRLLQDPTLFWQTSVEEGAIQSENRLWLCDIDETSVVYG